MDLLQNLVDVDSVGLLPLSLLLLLVTLGDGLGGLAGLLGSFSRNLWWHVDELSCSVELMERLRSGGYLSMFDDLPGDAIMRLRYLQCPAASTT